MKLKKTYSSWAAAFALAAMVSCSKDEAPNVQPLDEPQASQSYSEVIPDQFIVVFKEPGKMMGDHHMNKLEIQQKTEGVFKSRGVTDAKILEVYSAALSGVAVRMSKNDALKLRESNDVAYVEQDRIIALAPPCGTPNGGPCDGDGGGDGGGTSSQETPYGITRVNGGVASNGVAWVIDTGIDLDHEDLKVDASRGFNAFTSGRDAGSLDDGNGHGTHVAGTIAALDNNVGVVGVAAGATVIPVKVLDSRGSGSYSGVIAGVNHVAANGKSGEVANMSLGGPTSQALDDAVLAAASKGIKFALAAGNESTHANNSSPARVNGNNVYTVSAVDVNDRFASFSNYGNPPVDYAAPGVSIKSTWKNGGYNTISGTSMASPHVAGILVLGNVSADGTASGDPDGNADSIAVH
ncbi:S8 family serine peptidase [Salinimicrobium oceani]|uniref:S8 family serine peptidase n=1 Tax=Salinimicrobium oceani TaxID=2722702 RepID=A0ABX1CWU1_9FLAO|nr:S8 family serine peptidase [Salinimicrobium oceani]NJW51824.1 S8 family serine peptidase [Salinimicrobium oceani]